MSKRTGRAKKSVSRGHQKKVSRKGRGQKKAVPETKQKAVKCIGELRLHRDGYGFVVSAKPDQEDVFVPARYIGDALHTDLVEVAVVDGRGGKFEGRITDIVERRVERLMGRLERAGKAYQVVADDRRVRHRIMIPDKKLAGARHGENVVVKIDSYPSGDKPMRGEVIEVLGKRGEISTEKGAIISRHQLARGFSEATLREAEEVRGFMTAGIESEGRVDLRHIPFITIDGETAKDFDDAVAVERLEDGKFRLWVSIADVSFFVRPQNALDDEAYERGTSVYFPDDCIPMLPETLSNDLCSLKPDEDRLTMTAEMDIDRNGRVFRNRFYRSVIKSRERMTYTSVKGILVEQNSSERGRYREIVPMLEFMEECFKRLQEQRRKRGTIDFDLPEPQIIIDMKGEISDIVRADRHVGHMMIEEFMIAANEAVAEFLTDRDAGCVYRVHEPPSADKLREFSVLMHNLGLKFRMKKEVESAMLANLVEQVRGHPEERLVNHMLLRSMSRAVYSDENIGHYGLASKCYCHFTSPIRRYPDLVVHRLLTRALVEGRRTKDEGRRKKGVSSIVSRTSSLVEIAEHCSRRDRIAMEAEREVAKFYSALFMQDRIGEEFDGVISHITKFGFFVELIDYFVEGLVHINALDDDRYRFEEEGLKLVENARRKHSESATRSV